MRRSPETAAEAIESLNKSPQTIRMNALIPWRRGGSWRSKSVGALLVLMLLAGAVFGARPLQRLRVKLAQKSGETIIFIVVDTLRADRTSLCGYALPTTPTLERLAANGASFTCDAHTPASWTLPSHASFFTGRDVSEHGAGSGGGPASLPWGGVTPLGEEFETSSSGRRCSSPRAATKTRSS